MDITWRVRGGGVGLNVIEVGSLAAPPVVIAHGVGSSAGFVVECFAPALHEAGLRLVTYDARGHGRSTRAPELRDHDLDEHVADLDAIVARAGARIVGGVSLGAHAAAAWASGRAGIDGLMLCMPGWTGRAQSGVGAHAAIADEVRRDGVHAVLQRTVEDPAVPPWLAQLLDRDWRACDAASLTAALLALDGGRAPSEQELAAISAPTSVVGWENDGGHPLAVAESWATAVPRAVLTPIGMDEFGSDHALMGRAAVAGLLAARQGASGPPSGSPSGSSSGASSGGSVG